MTARVREHRVHKVREEWRCVGCDGRWGVATALPSVLEQQQCAGRRAIDGAHT